MFVSLQKKCIRPLFMISQRQSCQQYLQIKECDGTREIILNDKKTRNSLSKDMIISLTEAINHKKNDKSLRAIVLSSSSYIFSSGHNLKEIAQTNIKEHKVMFEKASELMKTIVQSPVPVIAKVNGIATAAGCQLVATCDLVVCSDISKFATPGANVGIFCSTPGIALSRCMPKNRVLYMLFTGELITAKDAYNYGLVNIVVPENELDDAVNKLVCKIKAKSRSIVAKGKQFYYKQIEMGFSEAYKHGTDFMVNIMHTPDGKEGIRSFVEKRPPKWSHE